MEEEATVTEQQPVAAQPAAAGTADEEVASTTEDIKNTQSQAEKLQKVMDFLNARIAENPEAIDDNELDQALNEPDEDDEDDDMSSDDDDAFEENTYDDDDADMDDITKELGSVNEDVDLDDLDDMF